MGEVEKLESPYSEWGGISEMPVHQSGGSFFSQGACFLFPSDLHIPLTLPSVLCFSQLLPLYTVACCQCPATHRIMGFPAWALSTLPSLGTCPWLAWLTHQPACCPQLEATALFLATPPLIPNLPSGSVLTTNEQTEADWSAFQSTLLEPSVGRSRWGLSRNVLCRGY